MSSGQKYALITGGNKGIGLETARQLGKMGITVILGCRDAVRGQSAADGLRREGLSVDVVQLDVTDAASISASAAIVGKRYGKLDILVNNAGWLDYQADGPGSAVKPETLRTSMEINFVGTVAVTQAYLPLLKAAPAARIVNLSSILGSLAEHADPNSPIYQSKFLAYDAAKAAVNMFTNHLAHELRGTKIKVNAAHPGWVKTDMGGAEATMEVVDGAKTSVMLATLDENGPTGGYFHMGVHMRW